MFNKHDTFDRHYEVILADNIAGRTLHYRIRYLVYCVELGFEDPDRFPEGLEQDHWDEQSVHFLVRTRATGEWIAAMRLVLPHEGKLPVEHLCQLNTDALPPVAPSQLGEISRLCVIDHVRHQAPSTGASTDPLKDIADVAPAPSARHESKIILGLLRAASAFSRLHGIKYWYFITTPALARRISRLNMLLKPIGAVVQHRGDRYPYLADLEESERRASAISADIVAMLAVDVTYRLYSEVCGNAMNLPSQDGYLSIPVVVHAVVK